MLCLLEKTHLNSLLGPERINAVFTGAARFLLNSEETRNKFDVAPFFDAMNNAGEPRWTDETKSIAGCQEGYLPDECVSPSTRNQQTLPKNRKERWWKDGWNPVGRLKSTSGLVRVEEQRFERLQAQGEKSLSFWVDGNEWKAGGDVWRPGRVSCRLMGWGGEKT